MKKSMMALVKKEAKKGLWLQEVPVPEYGINDVFIKVKKTGICGTDLHIYNWDEWSQRTIKVPMTIGHEFVGEIIAVGSNVQAFKPGDIVSAEGHIVCGHCRNCLAGRRHLCPNTLGLGVNRNGCFAEYVSIPAVNAWKCDPRVEQELFAIFDPYGNAVHTALSFDLVGEDVLITGAGPIGIMAAAICKKAGARFVVITDVNDYRLDLAKKMGATMTVNVSKEKIIDVQKKLGMTEGFDVGLEMSGNANAFRDMLGNMSNGGKIALLGILPKDTGIDWATVIFHGLFIKGIYGREMYETWYKGTSMILSGLDISPVVTHRMGFKDFEQGFTAMNTGNAGKVILNWE